VEKRKKKLTKEIYGTSHKVSLPEAKHIIDEGAELLVVGSGQSGCLGLSREAEEFFREVGCEVELHPTPKALEVWNSATGSVIAMFHVTC
jgi:hypothetical protein